MAEKRNLKDPNPNVPIREKGTAGSVDLSDLIDPMDCAESRSLKRVCKTIPGFKTRDFKTIISFLLAVSKTLIEGENVHLYNIGKLELKYRFSRGGFWRVKLAPSQKFKIRLNAARKGIAPRTKHLSSIAKQVLHTGVVDRDRIARHTGAAPLVGGVENLRSELDRLAAQPADNAPGDGTEGVGAAVPHGPVDGERGGGEGGGRDAGPATEGGV